ncbi:MAG: hypothetical protein IPH68_13100 [Chitinophagaceae bacterium]|nr:hypothetical protein [Chitinophagaceae bacterium]MBK7123656.1 hypothetical protein [Chitinophagaceae bacterium]
MSQMKVVGEYYFRKTEMVAGFNFSADGTFRFFFSYGAVDRNASGTFQADGDTLRLTSDKVAGRDFTITSQEKKGKGYSIVFSHPNKYLLTNIRCQFFTDGKMEDAFSDPEGKIHIDLAHCDSIYVQHLLYPDIATLVKDAANENNSFTLTLNDTMEQVSFKGIDFKIENDKTISCIPNYFLPMKDIKFVKQ